MSDLRFSEVATPTQIEDDDWWKRRAAEMQARAIEIQESNPLMCLALLARVDEFEIARLDRKLAVLRAAEARQARAA